MRYIFSKFSKKKLPVDIIISCAIATILVAGYTKVGQIAQHYNLTAVRFEKPASQQMFGYDLSKYNVISDKIKSGDVVGNLLFDYGVSHQIVTKLAEKARKTFSLRNIRSGRNYHMVTHGECGEAVALIYEPGPLNYVIYDLTNDTDVRLYEREYYTCTDYVEGSIESSLWQAMQDIQVNPGVIDLMEDALASSVDFYHVKKGDKFKLFYERKYIGDEEVGLGKLLGAYYENDLGKQYAIYYENGKYKGYYDEMGRPSKSSFLRSPVKYSRISSGYNLRRFHPIKRRTIPHLGTDYAAPYGTPIRAVGDGVVEAATRSGNNGNYVKIRHDKVYQTQYLHMQGFANGIRAGKKVRQGDVIGYVGSTGLATGPHVCFRFWKNGKQVNHLREVFKPADPLPAEELPSFMRLRDQIKRQLDMFDNKESGLNGDVTEA